MKHKSLLIVILVFSQAFTLFSQNDKLLIAQDWLDSNTAKLKVHPNHKFDMGFSHSGLSGETFRFYQMVDGIKVHGAEFTVHVSKNNSVTYHANTYNPSIKKINTIPSISSDSAFQIAKEVIKLNGEAAFSQNDLLIYNHDGNTKLIYKIIIEPGERPLGSWEVIIEAQTGDVISYKDKAYYYKEKPKKKTTRQANKLRVDGNGFVFETDPLTATNNVYGGLYVDGDDATNVALDAARTNVTLLDITLADGAYFLTGPYVEIQDFEIPNKGLFSQPTAIFNFNRSEDGFEAVSVYYHIDRAMRYYNETLGLNVQPYQYESGVRVDPSGLEGTDNSYYLGGSGRLAFGEGCVDDAEDADVVVHELGHGVHDWITNGAISPFLGEGNSDYLAASYKRSFGLWNASDPSYNFVFGWDGNNLDCWPGRTTAYPNKYPEGLVGLQFGAAHTDGQIWASTLMEIWDIIGREKTDIAFLEGLAMTNSETNQEEAAIAVRQAAIDIGIDGGFTTEDIQVFTDVFTARGYVLPKNDIEEEEPEALPISMFPNPTNGKLFFTNLNKEHDVIVFNMLGQKVESKILNTTDNTLDLSILAAGHYFIRFNTLDKVFKIIKN